MTQSIERVENLKRIEGMSARRLQLLDMLLAGKKRPSSESGKIPKAMRQAQPWSFTTSFAQQRLWFLDQLEPESGLYNIHFAFRAAGLLNIESLRQSIDEIVNRHEALRTTFSDTDGKPIQIISVSLPPSFNVVDLGGLSEAKASEAARDLAIAEADRPFNLSTGPLIRFAELKLSEYGQWLLLTVQHVIWDG
ncbi:MAG TPA: condensation domain-containing protein, partial [Blastocatellia bacterium]